MSEEQENKKQDLEEVFEEIVEETLEEVQIDLDVDKPYLIFERNDLIRVMNLVSKLVLVKSEVPEYNSVTLIPDPQTKTLTMKASNELSQFSTTVELLGEPEKMLSETFAVPYTLLQKVYSFLGSKVLIFKDGVDYYIRLANGDLIVGARQVNLDKIKFVGEVQDKLSEINVDELSELSSLFLPIMRDDINTDGKRLRVLENKAYYQSNFFYLETKTNLPDLTLSLKDLEFIQSLTKYYTGMSATIHSVKSEISRFYMKIDRVEYEFISTKQEMNPMLQKVQEMFKPHEIKVDRKELSRLISLSIDLPNVTGYLKMKYGTELDISIETNKNSSLMKIPCITTVTDAFDEEVTVKSILLNNLLQSFTPYNEIGIAATQANLSLESEDTKAIMLIGG